MQCDDSRRFLVVAIVKKIKVKASNDNDERRSQEVQIVPESEEIVNALIDDLSEFVHDKVATEYIEKNDESEG